MGDQVVASAPGVVTTAEPTGKRGYGHYVVVDHGNGESTLYGHLSRVSRRRPVRRPGHPARHRRQHRQRDRPAPALRGAPQAGPWRRTSTAAKFVFGSTQPRATASTCRRRELHRRRRAEVAVFRRGRAPRSRSPADRAPGSSSSARAPTSRSSVTGTATAWSTSVSAARRPGPSTSHAGRRDLRRDRQPQRHPGRGRLGRRRDSGRSACARPGPTSSGSRRRRHLPVALGDADDLPVTGDWNGDGAPTSASTTSTRPLHAADRGRRRPRVADPGPVRRAGDLPVTGDWDANGRPTSGSGTRARRRSPSGRAGANHTVNAFGDQGLWDAPKVTGS